MPAKKTKTRKTAARGQGLAAMGSGARRALSTEELTRRSVRFGRDQAAQFVASHKRVRRGRARVTAARPTVLRLAEFGAPGAQRFLMAKGDSWFAYGRDDIINVLERRHGYTIDAYAATGARIVQVANDGHQLTEFCKEIALRINNGTPPEAILLSGGGNDIADNFEGFLFHRSAARPGWNPLLVDGFVDGTIKSAYAQILAKVDAVCRQLLNRAVPILIHGYARPVPDGRGIFGNWLMDGFVRQGYTNLDERTTLAKEFIDKLNIMLSNLKRDTGIDAINYVDLRPALSAGANYKTYWANELHPTRLGFEEVTKVITNQLSNLGISVPPGQLSMSLGATFRPAGRSVSIV